MKRLVLVEREREEKERETVIRIPVPVDVARAFFALFPIRKKLESKDDRDRRSFPHCSYSHELPLA